MKATDGRGDEAVDIKTTVTTKTVTKRESK